MPTKEQRIYIGCGVMILAATLVSIKLGLLVIGALLVLDAATGD